MENNKHRLKDEQRQRIKNKQKISTNIIIKSRKWNEANNKKKDGKELWQALKQLFT